MKNRILWLFLLGLIGILFVFDIIGNNNLAKFNSADAIKFKEEYEELNNILNSNGENKYSSISVNDKNKIKYIDFSEVMDILEDGTGVIYFGRPNCPWSRSAVPALLEAANETSIDYIYYFNADSIRDVKRLDENGKIVTDKEGSEEYYTLINKLSSIVKPYEGLNDDSIKRLYFPTVVFVKYGNIISYHTGTVETQKDPQKELSVKEQEELITIYKENINKIIDNVCNLNNIDCNNEGENNNEE